MYPVSPALPVSRQVVPFCIASGKTPGAYFRPTDTVLDLGCGTGGITLEIARKTKQVYAIDFSQGMIDTARQRAAEQKAENIRFMKTDLFEAGFQPDAFDVITAFNVLHYIAEQEELYAKIHELLKPGGLFISSTACVRESGLGIRIFTAGFIKLGIIPAMQFYRATELEHSISFAGFTIHEAVNISKLPERFIVARKNS